MGTQVETQTIFPIAWQYVVLGVVPDARCTVSYGDFQSLEKRGTIIIFILGLGEQRTRVSSTWPESQSVHT